MYMYVRCTVAHLKLGHLVHISVRIRMGLVFRIVWWHWDPLHNDLGTGNFLIWSPLGLNIFTSVIPTEQTCSQVFFHEYRPTDKCTRYGWDYRYEYMYFKSGVVVNNVFRSMSTRTSTCTYMYVHVYKKNSEQFTCVWVRVLHVWVEPQSSFYARKLFLKGRYTCPHSVVTN